jgi:hypothetical protein
MVAPNASLTPTAPAVGIFWCVDGVLVIEAELYGECKTHAAGHYEYWQEWQALGATRLAAEGYPDRIAWTEYDQRPRGRIVYETPLRRFVLYADRSLQKLDIVSSWRKRSRGAIAMRL